MLVIRLAVKHFGLVVSIFAVVSLIIFALSIWEQAEISRAQCALTQTSCSILAHLPFLSAFGFVLLLVLAVGGAYVYLKARETDKYKIELTEESAEAIKKLTGEEKTAFEIIAADGTMFQSDLIKKLGYSKVKVSRIIDRLEMRGLVERRRRGMANMIVVKHAK